MFPTKQLIVMEFFLLKYRLFNSLPKVQTSYIYYSLRPVEDVPFGLGTTINALLVL